ncbi:hypothetical protein FQ185_19050 [Pseudomonas sp. ANT_H12B]|nr:hypothetical protein FQ185_19050 [Pseudomonas sp. ANT_H12B]
MKPSISLGVSMVYQGGRGVMGRRTMFKFFAAYLSVCLLVAWGVTMASPWIASHVLLRWMF